MVPCSRNNIVHNVVGIFFIFTSNKIAVAAHYHCIAPTIARVRCVQRRT